MSEPMTGPEGRTQEQIDLAVRTLAHIEAHPEEWDQTSWRCDAAACYAGHAALLAGAKWLFEDDPYSAYVKPSEGSHYDLGGWDGVEVPEFAQNALGLTSREAGLLFHSDNTLNDLREMVTAIQNREPFDE